MITHKENNRSLDTPELYCGRNSELCIRGLPITGKITQWH